MAGGMILYGFLYASLTIVLGINLKRKLLDGFSENMDISDCGENGFQMEKDLSDL
jgi:hypothetical protein